MPKIKYEEVNVLDENGNVVGKQRYPEGGSLYNEAKKAREEGGSYSVYQSGRPEEEVYTPVSEAKVTTTIDPFTGTITVDGPDWLTSEIINSDSFKQNYSENKALLGLVNMYRNDPDSSIADPTTGNPIKVADALRTFQDSANNYAGSFAMIKDYKEDIAAKYGTNFTDQDVAVANTFYDKSDYNKSGAVYIPEWAMDKYNWSSVGSWDGENKTVNAEDFFTTVYKQDFDDATASKLQEEALKHMEGFLDYNVYDPSDEEEAKTRQANMGDAGYATELARTIQMYNLVTQNKPETTALFNMAMFGTTMMTGVVGAAMNAGYNVSAALTQSFESVVDWGLDAAGVEDENRTGVGLLLLANPVYLSGYMAGEFLNLVRDGGNPQKIIADLQADALALSRGHVGDQYDRYNEELTKTFDEFNEKMQMISGSAAAGEMVGNLIWKITENIILLNAAGGALEKGISALGSGTGIATFMGKTMSAKSVANVFKVLGFAGNVTAQGLLETLVDDKQLINKAFASGEMTPELTERIVSNIWWNTIGEGTTRGVEGFLNKTVPGQIVSMNAGKFAATVGKTRDTILGKIFMKLNGFGTGEKIAEVATQTGRTVEALNIAGMDMANAIRDAILKNPIIGEASEDFDALVKNVADTLFPGKTLSTEELAAASKETADALEEISGSATTKNLTFKERVNANFERYQTLRIARADLENQIDAISKGVSIKQTQIEQTIDSDGTYTRFKQAETDMATVESKLASEGADLTIRKAGSLLSKEASETISLKSQLGHYKWQLENADAIGLTSSRINTIKRFVTSAEEKITGYEAKYGAEWAMSTDRTLEAIGRYNKALTDYMIDNGYVDKDYVDLIYKLRTQGYGEDGSLYIPTSRLFTDEDIEAGVRRFSDDNFSDKVALFRSRKVVGDDPLYLEPGDIDSSFIDPTMVIFAKTRAAATVAQAQDLGRAVEAANMITRQLKGLSTDGFSDYEVSLVEKGLAGLKNELNSVVSPNGDAFSAIIKDNFLKTDAMRAAYDYRKLFDRARSAKGAADRAEKAYNAAIRKEVTAKKRWGIIEQSSSDELSVIIDAMPDDIFKPSFDILGQNANTFKSWYDSLPDYLQEKIIKDLDGQKLNVTNVKKLARGSDTYIRDLQSTFILNNKKAVSKLQEYQDFTLNKYDAQLEAEGKTALSKPRENYLKALEKQYAAESEFEGAPKWNPKDIETLGGDFNAGVRDLRQKIVDSMIEKLGKSTAFNDVVENVIKHSNGAFGEGDEALTAAREYVVLNQLHNVRNGKKFAAPLNDSVKGARSLAFKTAQKGFGKEQAKHSYDIANAIGDGLKADIDSEYARLVNVLKNGGGSEAIDMKTYWNDVQKEMKEIEGRGLKSPKDGSRMPDYNSRKIIQLIGKDGTLKYYETDPMYAFAANASIDFHKTTSDALAKTILGFNAQTSQIFRWGTTGIDLASYVNQWFRDSMDAAFVGAAKPFVNLSTGSPKSFMASIASDSIPFGERVFGRAVTDALTDSFIESTYESTQKGLVAQYGQEWWDKFAENAIKGVAPEEAEQALKRAAVTFSVDTMGMSRIPGQGGMTEAEFYRAGGGKVEMKDVRREQMQIAFGAKEGLGTTEGDLAQWQAASRKMQEKIDNFFRDTSRGNWRESFNRRSIYASQYRMAIDSGMTMQEAQIWATRFALDATTDFGRTFAYANRFIKSVPYLGAAINGHKSFFRLLELDPAGVSTRFTFGLILPYITLLTESLSDPKNREIYKTIREYEKQDSVFLVYKGSKIQIPIPQQLSRFLAPFRHVVEKAADAQDASWRDLMASDILGVFPVDLSGFVDLDANDILMDDDSTGLWTRIGRGIEKTVSSLMPPIVKSAYMIKSGRDPYTGRDIDTSHVYIDENGEEQIMDSTKSDIAKGFSELSKKFGWNLSASAANKVLQSLFGRSTISVLDNAKKLFSGDIKSFNEALASEVTSPVDGGSDYDEAKSNWQKAIDTAYAKREELINDDGLQKALAVIRDEKWDSVNPTKRENALQVYRNKIDEYSKFVLDIANNMRQKYPGQYTDVRVAQIVSLLTFPTGITYNDTDYSRELQKDSYYDARNAAINTLVDMGFPMETSDNNLLGHGYYDKHGEYQFKVNTPYEIQYLQSAKYGNTDQIQAMVKKQLDDAEITSSKMWDAYYSAGNKAERKQVSDEWNTMVVKTLYPVISRYGANSVLSDSATRDMLEDYLLISNPYKKKQYMYQIFGGEQ